jgi:hypothetical protein
MVGSNIQLFAIGPQDFHLTGNPQITFFKSVFRRHTNFMKDIRKINFSGDSPTFGSKDIIAKIKRDGDLLSNVYVEATITGTTDKIGAYTVNHFGNSLIKKVEIEIGGYVIDTHYSQWLQIYDELTQDIYNNKQSSSGLKGGVYSDLNFTSDLDPTEFNSNNRINADNPLVFGGSRKNENISSGTGTYTKKFIVPLNFWFTKDPGLYLPLCAIYKHDINLKFTIEDKHKLIGDSTHITSLTGTFKVYGEFFHLEDEEKRRFSQSNHEYIIEQVQLNNNGPNRTSAIVDSNNQLVKIDYELNFKHPIKYMAWVIVNEGANSISLSNNSGQGPCYFVSQCSNSIYGNDANDGTVELLLDGVEREMELPLFYYTRLYPQKYCKSVPELDRIGLYSFALNPFKIEPSGTCNFSKINDKNIKIAFANNNTDNITDKNLYFFGVNYNVLVITDGMVAVRYT